VARSVHSELRRQQFREGTRYLATVAAVLAMWASFSWTINRNASSERHSADRSLDRSIGAAEFLAQQPPDTTTVRPRQPDLPLRAASSVRQQPGDFRGRKHRDTNF
jgi:hypothetical protein